MKKLMLALVLILSACATTIGPGADGKLTAQQAATIERVLPQRLALLNKIERHGLKVGRALTPSETELARKLGVRHPEKVRVAKVASIPMRNTANRIAKIPVLPIKLWIREVGALTSGYAIFIAKKYADKEWVLAHELVHVAQLEEAGKVAMIRRVLTDQILFAGKLPPIEQEAIERSSKVLGIKPPPYAY